MALVDNSTHYWKCDESSGNIADSVGSDTGTNSNVTFGAGIINNGGVYDAVTDKFTFTGETTLISGTSNFTLSFWVKYTSGLFIICRRDSFPDDWQMVNNGGDYQFTTGSDIILSYTPTPDANFHHIVVTRESTTSWVMYYDGVSQDTSASNISIPSGHTLTFGDDAGGDGIGAVMTLDEVGTWSRALSGAEVTQLYNSGAGLQYPFGGGAVVINNLSSLGAGS